MQGGGRKAATSSTAQEFPPPSRVVMRLDSCTEIIKQMVANEIVRGKNKNLNVRSTM